MRGAQALEAADSPDPEELCELVVHRAELQQMAGETEAGRETGLRAAQLARDVASPKHLARAALAYAGFLIVEMGRADEVEEIANAH